MSQSIQDVSQTSVTPTSRQSRQSALFSSAFALLCSIGMFSSAVGAEELVVQADRWCPYNCIPGTSAPGYVVEILQASLESSGTKIRYQIVPWDRTLIQVRDGKAGAAIAATQHEVDAFGLIVGSESIGYSSDCLYVAASNRMKFSKAEDLDTLKRIGLASGYTYSEEINAWLDRPENKGKIFVQKGEGPAEINARNLALGRLDGVIEDNHVMQQVIGKFGLEHELVLAGCQQQTRIFVAFSPKLKNVTSVVKRFDEGVGRLRQSGQLAKILAKYGLSDWK
jgi:polar amino acid transport system substrate-binding protein